MNSEDRNRAQTAPEIQSRFQHYIGFDVCDRDSENVGSVEVIWADQTGQATFVGVKTGWFSGKAHVIPAHGLEINEERELIRIPYLKEEVKDAPCYDPEENIDYDREHEVFSYYRTKGSYIPAEEPRRHERQAGQTHSREEASIPLSEEELRVGKRTVDGGGVRLHKVVRTETVQRPVELQREDVEIERVPANDSRRSDKQFRGEDVFIPLRREEPVVEKEAHVREEVRARKTSGSEHQTVSGEVRKEDVEVSGKSREDERRR